MAMVYLRQHNENIYNVERPKTPELIRPNLIRKRSELPGFDKSFFEGPPKDKHKTMGYAKTPLRTPCEYLRKREGIQFMRTSDHKCLHLEPKPSIPRRGSAPPLKRSAPKNLRLENIKNISCAEPKPGRPRYADTRFGEVHDLRTSGLMPTYVFSRNFAKVPKYIMEAKKGRDDKKDKPPTPKEATPGIIHLSQEERKSILNGLRAKWEDLQKQYQRLPLFIDTQPKKVIKTKLENDLKQAEQDIMLFEANENIYVCDFE